MTIVLVSAHLHDVRRPVLDEALLPAARVGVGAVEAGLAEGYPVVQEDQGAPKKLPVAIVVVVVVVVLCNNS